MGVKKKLIKDMRERPPQFCDIAFTIKVIDEILTDVEGKKKQEMMHILYHHRNVLQATLDNRIAENAKKLKQMMKETGTYEKLPTSIKELF